MSAEDNKAVFRRLTEALNDEVWPNGNLEAADQFISPDYTYHSQSMPLQGREGFRQLLGVYRTAFPDARFTIEEQIAEGDKVLTRMTVRGTHTGALMDIPASGKPVEVSILSLTRVADGQIAEEWERFDSLYLMQQIGAIPAQAAATS